MKFKDIEIVGEISLTTELIPTCEAFQADLLIADTRLNDGNCFEVAKELTNQLPEIKMIFTSLTFYKDTIDKLKAIGACGYFQRAEAFERMMAIIESVIQMPKASNGYTTFYE